jgi:hypothetical protein
MGCWQSAVRPHVGRWSHRLWNLFHQALCISLQGAFLIYHSGGAPVPAPAPPAAALACGAAGRRRGPSAAAGGARAACRPRAGPGAARRGEGGGRVACLFVAAAAARPPLPPPRGRGRVRRAKGRGRPRASTSHGPIVLLLPRAPGLGAWGVWPLPGAPPRPCARPRGAARQGRRPRGRARGLPAGARFSKQLRCAHVAWRWANRGRRRRAPAGLGRAKERRARGAGGGGAAGCGGRPRGARGALAGPARKGAKKKRADGLAGFAEAPGPPATAGWGLGVGPGTCGDTGRRSEQY